MLLPRPGIAPKERLQWLDCLRGIAVLGVVLVHSGQLARLPGGFVKTCTDAGQYGVQLFFIVSAITIGLTYESHLRKFGSGIRSNIGWLTKRFFRIAPLYYLAAIFFVTEEAVFAHTGHALPSRSDRLFDLAANLLFLHTWLPSANNSVVPGGWSIGAEMFFYLTIPFLFLIRRDRVRFLLLWCLMPVALVSLAHSGSLTNDAFLYYWFPTQYPVFAVGLSLYFYGVKRQIRPTLAPAFFVVFVVLLVSGVALSYQAIWAVLATPVLIGAAFACLVLGGAWPLSALLQSPALAYVGRVSFSVYLVHFVVLDAFHVLMKVTGLQLSPYLALVIIYASGGGASIVLASITKKRVEDPGVNLGHKLADRIASSQPAS